MRAKDVLGRLGEDAAVRHLMELGWTIIQRNWRYRFLDTRIARLEADLAEALLDDQDQRGQH